MSEKRGRGRPKMYDTVGAPKLTVRVAPDVYEHVTTRPEGARPYIEQLVRKDRDGQHDEIPLTDERHSGKQQGSQAI